MPGYAQDLAYIHHVGFTDFARKAAPWILQLLREHGISEGLVVELGCGSGVTSRELTAAGYRVLGIDHSAAMLKLARAHAPQAEFRRASWSLFETPSCDAVTAIGEVLGYRFEASADRPQLMYLFRRVYEALRPGGIFLFDLACPGQCPSIKQKQYSGSDWAVLVKIEEHPEFRRRTRYITAFRKVGRHYRRSEEIHELQLYKPNEIARELRECGFRVNQVRAYGEQRFPAGLVGFVALRPA